MNMNESYDQSTIVESTGNGCTEFVHEHLGQCNIVLMPKKMKNSKVSQRKYMEPPQITSYIRSYESK